jgi:hypothetical protein
LDRKWTSIILWSWDRASISVQQLRRIVYRTIDTFSRFFVFHFLTGFLSSAAALIWCGYFKRCLYYAFFFGVKTTGFFPLLKITSNILSSVQSWVESVKRCQVEKKDAQKFRFNLVENAANAFVKSFFWKSLNLNEVTKSPSKT